MIGTIRFASDAATYTATLHDTGAWTIDPPLPGHDGMQVLPILADISESYDGPSQGPFGPKQLRDASIYLRLFYRVESVDLVPTEPMPPGTVY